MAAATLGTSCTPGANASVSYHANAVALEVGQSVFIDEADSSRLKLADDSSAVKANARGIAISKANVANQRVGVVWNGDVENCTSGTQGEALFLSDTPGSLCPAADLGTGDFGTFMGFRKAATTFTVHVFPSGVAHG